ncbi:unnamed protein product [Peniophora sp. CBMAI 1063]|nr:unnamed protein product [Peniophora sp. CBMAI 1063]
MAQPAATPPPSQGLRISLNLKPLLSLPRRLLQRIREVDGMLDQQAMAHHRERTMQSSTLGGISNEGQGPPPPGVMTPMPGPWGFFASGYAVVLFAMAILLNRIAHIVVPSRHNPRLSAHQRRQLSFFRSLWATLFPMDLSSTAARTVLRIPSLYFVMRSLGIWILVLLHASDNFPTWEWARELEHIAAHVEMEHLCWSTFLSVCGALSVGALTRGLEGGSTANAAPFNLFGYAFLLHIYSAPMTHTVKEEGLPSRPDVHVLFVIMLPLLQLALLHAIGVNKRWASQRLIPTAFCSLLSLVHFHAVVWRDPSRYPLLNYMSCVFETLLLAVILITFSLNAFTQLATEGGVSRLLFGHADALMPRPDEDFSVVLLRLGTASLEATSVAGLGNEVGSVPLAAPQSDTSRHFGELEMNSAGVTSLTHAVDGKKRQDGFSNEIRNVKVGSTKQDQTWGIWPNHRELMRFGEAFLNAIRSVALMAWRLIRLRPVFAPRAPQAECPPPPQDPRGPTSSRALTPSRDEVDTNHDLYRRFLSGETVSDDEEDFHPRSTSAVPDSEDEESDTPDSPVEEDTEHLAATALSDASASLLLAHMSSPNSALTRRRYSRVQAGEEQEQPTVDAWERFVEDKRRAAQLQQDTSSESRRLCVICTCEERQIICWPCRCLALCDDCRENLASRVAPSKHTCPCCRQPVEGFSRIYIP